MGIFKKLDTATKVISAASTAITAYKIYNQVKKFTGKATKKGTAVLDKVVAPEKRKTFAEKKNNVLAKAVKLVMPGATKKIEAEVKPEVVYVEKPKDMLDKTTAIVGDKAVEIKKVAAGFLTSVLNGVNEGLKAGQAKPAATPAPVVKASAKAVAPVKKIAPVKKKAAAKMNAVKKK